MIVPDVLLTISCVVMYDGYSVRIVCLDSKLVTCV